MDVVILFVTAGVRHRTGFSRLNHPPEVARDVPHRGYQGFGATDINKDLIYYAGIIGLTFKVPLSAERMSEETRAKPIVENSTDTPTRRLRDMNKDE
ncbi:hypothetical protein ACSSNL_18420 [Thalassobius sp. S69A]|uniref:hypothetical protein n=1 Tax=Thalassobius sp. S69A TaxID=3450125 RepID=UPI000C101B0D|nr:hypothetical protein [Paracoccaceae bacterium]MBT26957.1 hypothetical protein [Paracoccaceae bacterium]|tara:strand:+ start:2733 stop:3023 length:291 start_codon:yes stop_codon:yes gene_type:complete